VIPRTCDKCKTRSPVEFGVKPEEAWRTGLSHRRHRLCPGCLDQVAEGAGIAFTFEKLEAVSWSERPAPRGSGRRRRR
jgi:hypothetical protein